MKIGVISCIALLLSWTLLALVQLWFAPLSPELFIKLSITIGVLLVVGVIILLAIREYLADKRMKDDGFID